jgi:hypothetical protein
MPPTIDQMPIRALRASASVMPGAVPIPKTCVKSPAPASPTPTWNGTTLNTTAMSRTAPSRMNETNSGGGAPRIIHRVTCVSSTPSAWKAASAPAMGTTPPRRRSANE